MTRRSRSQSSVGEPRSNRLEREEPLADSLAGEPPFRRLFLDAMVVEKSHGLDLIFHTAEKHSGNPIIRHDKPWEGWGPYLYGTVLRHDGTLKMWYQVIGKDSADVCYAESRDGLKWVKPELGIVEYKGSKANKHRRLREALPYPRRDSSPKPDLTRQAVGTFWISQRGTSRFLPGRASMDLERGVGRAAFRIVGRY